jgi:GTP-binding protein SAR1
MWLLDKFFDLLQYFGLFKKSARILFLGLDNAGKTTLFHLLKNNRMAQHAPTAKPTSESLSVGPVNFTAFDLGGHVQARRIWRDYFDVADALVFIIDAFDQERLQEAKSELHDLMEDETLADLPLLILGNKIDKPGALSAERLKRELDFDRLIKIDRSKKAVFMCSLLQSQGYGDGFRWLAEQVN